MALAKAAGIASPSVINGWRLGKAQPGRDNLRKIAAVAGEPPVKLFTLTGLFDESDLVAPAGPPAEPMPPRLRKLVDELMEIYRHSGTNARTVLIGQLEFLVDAMRRR